MGRRPESQELQDAKGNPSKRPKAERQSRRDDNLPVLGLEVPDFILGNERAVKIWKVMSGILQHSRFMRQTDSNSLARYCLYMADWLTCRKQVETEGSVYEVESRHGSYKRSNPSFDQMLRLEKVIAPLEDRLGLNPAFRQKLSLHVAANALEENSSSVTDQQSSQLPLALAKGVSGVQRADKFKLMH